jgi:hypothetical protein
MKLHQISDDDLTTLETALPELQEAMMTAPDVINRKDVRDHLDMVRQVLSRVRWNYGPPSEVKRIEDSERP